MLDQFDWCALAAGSISRAQGREGDSHYERVLAYAMYEAVLRVSKNGISTETAGGIDVSPDSHPATDRVVYPPKA